MSYSPPPFEPNYRPPSTSSSTFSTSSVNFPAPQSRLKMQQGYTNGSVPSTMSYSAYNPYSVGPNSSLGSGYGHHHSSLHPSMLNGNPSSSPLHQNIQQQQQQPPPQQQQPPATPNQYASVQDSAQPVTAAWAKQLEWAAISRQSSSPHHHARQAQLQQRGHNNSALVIVDPKDSLSSVNSSAVINGSRTASSRVTLQNHRKSGSLSVLDSKRTAIKTPNGTAKEVAETAEKGETGWSTLDMGGMALKNLSPALFQYHFLTALYIPHNALTALPIEICQLNSLVRLDASSNKLTTIPSELGTLITLRELFLFDNQIVTLPAELGTLHLLEMIGVEGNPLQDSLRSIVEKDGTTGLVSFLRDSCPVPMPPPDREWIPIEHEIDNEVPSAENAEDKSSQDGFSVLCYNILCERMATTAMYGYTPSWALSWEYRKELILQEVMGYAADILCLQEVAVEQYEEYFQHNLSQQDYEGVYWPKSRARTMSDDEKRHVDGCAIFYKATTFSLVEQQLIEFNQVAMRRPDFKKTEDMFNRVMTRDNIAVVALLEHRTTGARLIVANAHITWAAEFRDVKLVQTAMMMDEIKKIADRFARLPPRLDLTDAPSYSNGSSIPTLVCGDFNSIPESGVYEFLSKGRLSHNHEDFMDHIYGNYTSDGLDHDLHLKSAYSNIGELPFTNYTPGFRDVIDYVWYTTDTLSVTGVLGEVDQAYLSKVVGFPNAHYPSDHLCILAEFKQKKSKSSKSGAS